MSAINWTPGPDSSSLLSTEKAVDNSPDNNINIRYNVPIYILYSVCMCLIPTCLIKRILYCNVNKFFSPLINTKGGGDFVICLYHI